MTDDSSESSGNSPVSPPGPSPPTSIRDSPLIDNHLRAFLESGYPHFHALMDELKNHRDELPRDAQLAVFLVVGGFMHSLNDAVLEHDLDILTAIGSAVNSVMGKPEIAKRIQDMMDGAVADIVRRQIE
tara:strand:+ start:1312 stop:1698 length:387 start_codon:yes stop_codon:yes gene_type:complete